jgi:hypothetical protein
MANSIFEDKAKKPDDEMVSEALGKAKKLWDELKGHVLKEYAPASEEWKYYNSKSGWILTIRDKKCVITYMSPGKGQFMAGVTLGKTAVEAAMASSLPKDVVELVKNAPQYPEGRVVGLEVRKKQDLESMKKLVAMRMGKQNE